MPTLNTGRVGYVVGTAGTNFATSRTANGSSAVDSPTGNVAHAIQSFFSSGRGGGTYRQTRVYIYFDTSGITSTVSSATLKITGHSNTTSDVIVMNGQNAFGGDGDDALATNDFNEVNIGGVVQPFSSNESWSTGLNSISLNSTALSAIEADDDTVMGVINYAHDYANSAPTSTVSAGIAFGTTIQLEYAVAASSNITSLNGITRSNITSFNAIALADIDEINRIDN